MEVLQLSVQQEGEADMDVELLRKGLLAVKLKEGERDGEEEEEDEEEAAGMMPGRRLSEA